MGRAIADWGRSDRGSTRRPDLPWRSTQDPWSVLVSEVMAQQTQVARVVPVYERFVAAFPTPRACASAPLASVLRAWRGLGYNRRAQSLHRAAAAIVADHRCSVPADLPSLVALPGVGEYTARAVLAFAFCHDVGVVDTNSGRVLARAAAGRALGRAEAQALVDTMVPPGRGWAFGQSLLDLGALVCAKGAPRCTGCPVRRRCRWAARGHAGPDPADRSAGVSRAQAPFDGSDRQARGRMLDALRDADLAASRVADAIGWAEAPERVPAVVAGLVRDGLVVRDRRGRLRLPP